MEQMMDHLRRQCHVGIKSCEHIMETPDACGHVIEYAVIPASPPGRVRGGREQTGEIGFNRNGLMVS